MPCSCEVGNPGKKADVWKHLGVAILCVHGHSRGVAGIESNFADPRVAGRNPRCLVRYPVEKDT
jgi:hypothetical protein